MATSVRDEREGAQPRVCICAAATVHKRCADRRRTGSPLQPGAELLRTLWALRQTLCVGSQRSCCELNERWRLKKLDASDAMCFAHSELTDENWPWR